MSSAKEAVELRRRFGTSMVHCRFAALAYPDDFPAQFGCLYRRVAGRLPDGATEVIGSPWRREFDGLAPSEQARMLDVARQRDD